MGKKRRPPTPLLVVAGGLGLAALVIGLGYLLATLVQLLLAGGSPLGAAVCLGSVVLVGMAAGIVGIRALARRFADGSTAQRAVTLGGLILLMTLAPFTMIVIVVVLALQGGR